MDKKNDEKLIEEELIHKGKFLSFWHYKFKNKEGTQSIWETIIRVANYVITGSKVIPIGISKSKNKRFIIVIANFRIPIKKYVIEFPAGINEATDKEGERALIELKEETGYKGELSKMIQASSVYSYTDPWKSNDRDRIYYCEIDLDDIENQSPKQHTEKEEDIKVFLIDESNFYEEVLKLKEENNFEIENSVYFFAQGLRYSKIQKLNS